MQRNIFEINLYKNISTKDTFIWGGFDSLEIVPASNIHKMALDDFSLLEGEKHSHKRLHSFPENKYIIYDFNIDKNGQNKERQEKKFQGITLLSFDWKNFRKNKNYKKEILPYIIKNIENCKNRSRGKIEYEVYGCLSNYDLCIISYFNEIKEFIIFIENIQEISLEENIPIFSNTFSILRLNKEKIEENCFSQQDKQVKVQIQLTYNCQIKWEDILKLFKRKLFYKGFPEQDCVFSSLGEYDIVIEMSCKNFRLEWFVGEEGIFSPENSMFKKRFYQCNTRFMLVKDTKKIENENLLSIDDSNEEKENDIENTKDIKELFLNTKNYSVKYMVMLLYRDYIKATQSQLENWKYDVIYQCNVVVDCMKIFDKFLADSNENYPVNKNEIKFFYKQIINDLEYSVNHLEQSFGFRGLWTSNSFRNTGSYDKIFKFYYGIVKGVLATIYTTANNKQSELVPIITVDAVTIPTSTIYIDQINPGKGNKRLLTISLPMDVWYNIPYYAPLLIHEIAHYFCPIDREQRNKDVLFIIITYVLEVYYQDYTQKSSAIDRKDIIEWLEQEWNQFIKLFSVDYKNTWKKFFAIICYKISRLDNEIEHNEIRDLIQKYIKDKTKNKLTKDIVFYRKKIEVMNEIKGIASGIREAVADKFMIDYIEMDSSTYIAYLIVACIKREIVPERELAVDVSMEMIIRVGIILDILEENLANYSGTIERKMFGKENYQKIKVITESMLLRTYIIASQQKLLEKLIKKYYEDILEAYSQYHSKMIYYRKILCNIVKSTALNFNNNITVLSSSKFYGVKYNTAIKKLLEDTAETFNILKKGIGRIKKELKNQIVMSNDEMIQVIESFLLQPTLSELGEYKKSIENNFDIPQSEQKIQMSAIIQSEKKQNHIKKYNDTIYIYTKESIAFVFDALKSILCDKESEKLWFRGQVNEEWNLIPAVFRVGENYKKQFIASYEKFRADAWGGIELHGRIEAEADWIAYMQHYLLPTNFLDWSEQPLVSLYFALENFFEDYCKYQAGDPWLKKCRLSKKKNEIEKDAILYALNPVRMNAVLHNNKMLGYDVPNLSIKENEEKYKMYLIPREEYEVTIKEQKELFELLTKFEEKRKGFNQLPIAIQTAQLSSRLKAQRGHFVAYNTNITINKDNKKIEKMLDLVNIQQITYNRNPNKFKPFLMRIVIADNLKREFSKWVKNMGISLSRIYPELGNIGKDIRRDIYNK